MLKNIDVMLNADLLHALRSMGHGDQIAVVDTNFPTDRIARQTVVGKALHVDNVGAARAVQAILSVMPLDTALQNSAGRMEVSGNPDEIPMVQREVQLQVNLAEGRDCPMYSIERFAFYELAKKAYCVVQTGEPRFFGCFLLTMGVIPPAANE
ncbi:RbsD/FucU family protein [Brucella haematophila]|uniref:RbsD/FucU family protein n=1 Tax=Brucella haematophila TaxID=419474 RepID=UPI00110EA14B|nr:RbsD/FucU domain-containing protein [Brucella haematophila]TMV04359.1 fucose-binding protein [Brucella haematophila]